MGEATVPDALRKIQDLPTHQASDLLQNLDTIHHGGLEDSNSKLAQTAISVQEATSPAAVDSVDRGPAAQNGDQYTYQPFGSTRWYRVFELQPALNIEEPIRGVLRTITELDPDDYSALSYAWKKNENSDDQMNRTIYLHDKELRISENLYDCLRRIRDTEVVRRLWIDAICINQSDHLERSEQVARMSRIYLKANETIVWLGEGPSTDADYEARHLLHRLYNVSSAGYSTWLQAFFHNGDKSICTTVSRTTCPCRTLFLGLPDNVDGSLCGVSRTLATLLRGSVDLQHRAAQLLGIIHTFFKRRYWCRRWVVQEMQNSKRKLFRWGPCYVSEDVADTVFPMVQKLVLVIRTAVIVIASTHRDAMKQASEHDLDLWSSRAAEIMLGWIEAASNAVRDMSTSSLEEAWARYSYFDCSDPRDRLYALFGIFQIADPNGGDHVDALHGMTPDYSLSAGEVYTAYAQKLIEKKVYRCIFCNLQHSTSSTDPIVCKFPSWVPDLRRRGFMLSSGRCSPHECVMSDDGRSISFPVFFLGVIGEDLDRSRKTFSLINAASDSHHSDNMTSSQSDSKQSLDVQLTTMYSTLSAQGDVICAFEEEYDETKDVNDVLLVLRKVETASIPLENQQVANTYVISHNIFTHSLSRVDGVPLKWRSPKNSMKWIRVI